MEIVGGNIVEGPRQYLQATPSQSVGGSAAAPTTANTCNNLPLDNARPVAMETTPNPLAYWPPPSSDSPLTNNSKDAGGDDGLRKHAPRFNHSYPPIRSNWSEEKTRAPPSPHQQQPLPTHPPRTHNLPPIAAITSSHNYRGVREAAQKHQFDVKMTEPSQHENAAEVISDSLSEAKSEERPKVEYVFPVPTAVHPHANNKTLPLPRAPTPFATTLNNHQYHAQPESLTLNIGTTSGVSSGSPSPSNRIAPSPHFGGPAPTGNRLPNVPSPSESPRVLPSPHSNVPSPSSSTASRQHSSPHPNLSSPSTEAPRIPSSPHPPSNSTPPNRFNKNHPYPSYPYLNTPRPNLKPSPIQNVPLEPCKVLPNESASLPVRLNQNDTHSCRNPFELPTSKPYPQQQQQQPFQPYPQMKLNNYYPYGKMSEKGCGTPQAQSQQPQTPPVTSKTLYSMESSQYGHSTQQQPQHPGHHRTLQMQKDFVNYQKQSDVRTWPKTEASDINQKGSYLNSETKNNFNKLGYAGNEYQRVPGVGYQNFQKTVQSRQPSGGFPGVAYAEKTQKNHNQSGSLSQRFPPVPQSNYDLNRQIYDRMTAGNQQQQQVQQRTDKPITQMAKPQINKPHPYYRDYSADKEKPKSYQEYQPNSARSYPQYNFRIDEPKTIEAFQKRNTVSSYPFNPGDKPTGQHPEHHRQGFAPVQSQQQPAQQEIQYQPESRFVNPQNVPASKVRPTSSVPAKPKRESPLDLSVKTVRQSADSTAKDDNEAFVQNFRHFLGSESSRYQITNGPTTAPKIDFTPNFSGFHAESQPKAEAASSVLPPVESFKKLSSKDGKPYTGEHGRFPLVDHYKSEAQKRSSNDPCHSSQPKLPKIEAWRLAIDQQIEQRLNSARQSQLQQQQLNGTGASKPPTIIQHGSNYTRHIRNTGMYPRPPVQTSAAPYNPSSYPHQPQCQPATPQTPQENVPHRDSVGNSPDPEQIIKQISKGVMPDHKLLQDKNVMNILRSSLEEKEAKLIQLREAARRKEKMKEQEKKVHSNYEQLPRGFPSAKQALPPFGAITLERMCAPPSFPGHKLNVPRPVDTVKIDIEPTRNYLSPAVKQDGEKSGIPSIDPSPQDDAQGPPTDLDGLAAFLAARIRTKAELKQVGPSLDNLRALSSHRSPKAADPKHGLVTSLPDTPDRLPGSNQTSSCSTTGSPPKLTRESRLLPPFRRRLFSHTDDEVSNAANQNDEPSRPPMPPRDSSGIRSSSETSVFDFRESDSEGEMPVLERQTLEEMRRDRKSFGSKQNVSTTTPDEPTDVPKPSEPEKIAELEISEPDPFWNTAFDMFVEQLEKRPPKRSIRKKRPNCRLFYGLDSRDPEDKLVPGTSVVDDFIKTEPVDVDSSENSLDGSIEVKLEPQECESVEKHEKLSASRLRVYRNELKELEDREKELNGDVMETVTGDVEVKKEKTAETEAEVIAEESERGKEETETEVAKVEGQQKKAESRTRGKKAVDSGSFRSTRASSCPKDDSGIQYDSDIDLRDLKSDSSSIGDDDDSISISGMESESTDSDLNAASSNSNFSSDDEDGFESEEGSRKRMRIQTRMQTRTSKLSRTTGMRLRSKAMPVPKATLRKSRRRRKRKKRKVEGEYYMANKKKKPAFGDGSHFRPGWEEECYKFKQQLRMPEKLINISRPPKRSSVSLPDLDPYRNSPSMSLDSSDVSLPRKQENLVSENESEDLESKRQKRKSNDASSQDSDAALTSFFSPKNGKKSQTDSILNMLVNKYGRLPNTRRRAIIERKSPRILPKGNDKPELLPTPSLGIGKENVLKDKRKSKGSGVDSARRKIEESDSVYLGYFRRKTVNNFKEAFKEKGGLLPDEFSPEILKSRTRMQTKVLRKRATLVEVFGEDRPASAPPLGGMTEDGGSDAEKSPEKRKPMQKPQKRVSTGVVTRGKGMLTRSSRTGLRSAAVLRSNKAVQISKRHLNSGRKQRNIDLLRIRAMASKKFEEAEGAPPLVTQKRLKLRSVRRKFRSGFDYIRKKKKLKKDGESVDGSVKEKKVAASRPNSESVDDIQSEIKNWVINKGLGETILHRAARLGYTDVAAYCLEKMDCSPSPRDNAGYTPLHEACSRGHLDIAKLLLMYGASVSESAKGGIRPLHEAAENGFTELIRLLLSYGADPLLETYTGHTALSLVSDEDSRRLIQHHLADVQGNVAPPWNFLGPATLFDPAETGCDPLADPPSSPVPDRSDFELDACDLMLPPLYRLADDYPDGEAWVLLRDVMACAKTKSREAVLKQLNASREMKLSEFLDQAKCCSLLGAVERTSSKATKVVLVPYDDKLRQLLSIERILV